MSLEQKMKSFTLNFRLGDKIHNLSKLMTKKLEKILKINQKIEVNIRVMQDIEKSEELKLIEKKIESNMKHLSGKMKLKLG